MPHRVFIAGATGYTGRVLVPLLAKSSDWKPIAHVRPGSPHAEALSAGIERCEIDLANHAALVAALAGCEVAMSLIGTTRAQFGPGVSYETVDIDTTQWLVAAAQEAGVQRFVLLSSVGASATGVAYLRAKAAAEKIVMASALRWIILRPSAIVGPGRQFPKILIPITAMLRYFPGLQRFSDDYRPVHIEVLAQALCEAVESQNITNTIWSGEKIWRR